MEEAVRQGLLEHVGAYINPEGHAAVQIDNQRPIVIAAIRKGLLKDKLFYTRRMSVEEAVKNGYFDHVGGFLDSNGQATIRLEDGVQMSVYEAVTQNLIVKQFPIGEDDGVSVAVDADEVVTSVYIRFRDAVRHGYINEEGKLINREGEEMVEIQGRLYKVVEAINEGLMDEEHHLLDADGQYLAADGRKVDKDGYYINDDGERIVEIRGNWWKVLDAISERVINADYKLLDTTAATIRAQE